MEYCRQDFSLDGYIKIQQTLRGQFIFTRWTSFELLSSRVNIKTITPVYWFEPYIICNILFYSTYYYTATLNIYNFFFLTFRNLRAKPILLPRHPSRRIEMKTSAVRQPFLPNVCRGEAVSAQNRSQKMTPPPTWRRYAPVLGLWSGRFQFCRLFVDNF